MRYYNGLILFLFALLLSLTLGCFDDKPKITWPQFGDVPEGLVVTITDPADDQTLPAESPPSIIKYPPIDLTKIQIWKSEGYLYFRMDFSGTIPDEQQNVTEDTVNKQGANVVMDMDLNDSTGVDNEGVGGIDVFFSFSLRYGDPRKNPYANYNFQNNDIHQNSGHMEGELRGGGPDYNFAAFRFKLDALTGIGLYNSGSVVEMGGWSEAESEHYHHYAFDALTTNPDILKTLP